MDPANKIGQNSVETLMNAFSIFHSLNSKTDIVIHPRYHIIVNDMSKYGKEYDPVEIKKQIDKG